MALPLRSWKIIRGEKKSDERREKETDYRCSINSLGRTWPSTISCNQLEIPSSLYNVRIQFFLLLNTLNFLKDKNSVWLSVNSCWCSRTSQPMTPNNWDYCEIRQCFYVLFKSLCCCFCSCIFICLCMHFVTM